MHCEPFSGQNSLHCTILHIQSQNCFRGLIFPKPCSSVSGAWTQTPISAWLDSVPIVPVLRNDHCPYTSNPPLPAVTKLKMSALARVQCRHLSHTSDSWVFHDDEKIGSCQYSHHVSTKRFVSIPTVTLRYLRYYRIYRCRLTLCTSSIVVLYFHTHSKIRQNTQQKSLLLSLSFSTAYGAI